MHSVIDVPVVVVDDGRPTSFPRQGSWSGLRPPMIPESPHPLMSDTIFIPDGLSLFPEGISQKPMYEQQSNEYCRAASMYEQPTNGCFRAASFGQQLPRSNSVPVLVSSTGLDDLSFGCHDRSYADYSHWAQCQQGVVSDMLQDHSLPRVPLLMPEDFANSHAPPAQGHSPWNAASSHSGMAHQAGHYSTSGQGSWNMSTGNLSVPSQTWQPVGPPLLARSSSFSSFGANSYPPNHPPTQWAQYGGHFQGPQGPAMNSGMQVSHGSFPSEGMPWFSGLPSQSAIPVSNMGFLPSFSNPDPSLMAAARAALSLPLTNEADGPSTPESGEKVPRRLSLGDDKQGTRRPSAEVVHQPELPPSPSKSSKCPIPPQDSLTRKLASRPLHTKRIQYSDDVVIDIPECVAALMSVVDSNTIQQRKMARIIENGDLLRQAHKIYSEHDRDDNGYLTWQNGAVRDFITSVFRRFRCVPPNETQIYDIFIRFDPQRKMVLDSSECLCMVDAMFRATFIVDLRGGSPDAFSSDSNPNFPPAGRKKTPRPNDNMKEFSDWDIPSETPSMSVDSSYNPRHSMQAKASRRRNSYHVHDQNKHQIHNSHTSNRHHPHHSIDHVMSQERDNSRSRSSSPIRSPDLKAAAVAAAAAAAAAVAATKTRGDSQQNMSGQDALAEAKTETARLRNELQQLREIEDMLTDQEANKKAVVRLPSPKTVQLRSGSCNTNGKIPATSDHHQYREAIEDQSHIEVQHSLQHSPGQRTCFQPLASPPDETLLWTARAHAENCRLEQELARLREVAIRQRNEVQWLQDTMTSPNNVADLSTKAAKEEEEKAKKEDIEDFTRRLRLLQQKERDFDKEREFVLERERAVRDQELQLALERERQQVRRLMKERILDQREYQLEIGGLQSREHKLEKETQIQVPQDRPQEKRGVPQDSTDRGTDRPIPRTFMLGSGYSAVDTEPEAEADADVENEQLAVASAENTRLKQELEGLRQLAQMQRGEVDAAMAVRNGVMEERANQRGDQDYFSTMAQSIVDTETVKDYFSTVAQGIVNKEIDASTQMSNSGVHQANQQRHPKHGNCIPTVSSPGASPLQTGMKVHGQSDLASKEPPPQSRSLFSRVTQRSGHLTAIALRKESEKSVAGFNLRAVHQPLLHNRQAQ